MNQQDAALVSVRRLPPRRARLGRAAAPPRDGHARLHENSGRDRGGVRDSALRLRVARRRECPVRRPPRRPQPRLPRRAERRQKVPIANSSSEITL